MQKIQKNKNLFFLLTLLMLVSCNSKSTYNQYKSINNATWKANQNIVFQFDIKDTITANNLFINIRNNNKYPFSNLFVITSLQFPNGTAVTDTLEYEMTDNFGNFLGKGFADIKENKLFYKEKKIFPISGNYTFSVRQAMRKNGEINPIPFLEGVLDVGFSIEKNID